MTAVLEPDEAGESEDSLANMRLWARFFLFVPFLVPLLLIRQPLTKYHLGEGMALRIVVAVFIMAPLFDCLSGLNRRNFRRTESEQIIGGLEYRLVVRLWAFLILTLEIWSFFVGSYSGSNLSHSIALATSVGLIAGTIGIPVAHELLHRKSRFDKALAELLMCLVAYPHFCIEHIHGHHRHVCTPLDSASAQYGMNYYKFLGRSVPGQLRSVIDFERNRCSRRNISPLSLANRLTRYAVEMVVLVIAIPLLFGWVGLLMFAIQGVLAILLLEAINYVQHYGLVRREVAPGRYEPIGPEHSWNSAAWFSNLGLVNLGRHSDHHLFASRPFQALRDYRNRAPEFPTGLAFMTLAAFIPSLWFKIMNPLVLAERARARTGRMTFDDDVPLETVEEDLARFRSALRRGRFVLRCITIQPSERRQVCEAHLSRYGNIVLVGGMALFIGIGAVLPFPSGAIALALCSLGMVAFRGCFWRLVSVERTMHWATHQAANWDLVWWKSDIRLLLPGGRQGLSSSRAEDWRVALAPMQGLAAGLREPRASSPTGRLSGRTDMERASGNR